MKTREWRRFSAAFRHFSNKKAPILKPIIPDNLTEPSAGALGYPLKGIEIYIMESEPLGVPGCPFIVIHKGPPKISTYIYTFLNGLVAFGKITLVKINAVLILNLPIYDLVIKGTAILGNYDFGVVVFLIDPAEQSI